MDALLYMLAKGKETEDGRICRALRFDSMYSWLRVKNKKEFTSPHADIYYFRVSIQFFTFLLAFL